MKHLKPFKESLSYSLEDVTSYIRDMLLDFMDEGFNVMVKSMSVDRFDNKISVSIDTGFDYSTVPEDTRRKLKVMPNDFTISGEKIIEFSERMEDYFKMQNIVYEIGYQWHDNYGNFHDKKANTYTPKLGKIRNIWIEIWIEK